MIDQILREMAGKANSEYENAYDISNAKKDIMQLKQFSERYDAARDFEEGDIIEWKPGLRSPANKFPAYGEPVLCHQLRPGRESMIDAVVEPGAQLEMKDMVVAVIRLGGVLFFTYDSSRFRKYRAPNE